MDIRSITFTNKIDSKFGVGIVGAGNICSRIHLPLLEQMDETEPLFIADIDATQAKNLASKYECKAVDLEEGSASNLPECDIALLAVPVGVRQPYLTEFADREVPVFSEKPFAVDYETHLDILKSFDHICCNYMRTWYSSTRTMREIVDSEPFGSLQEVHFQSGMLGGIGVEKGSYRNEPSLAGGGVLIESGCHTLSQISHIFDQYDVSVKQAEIKWYEGLDVAIEAEFLAKKRAELVITYTLSRLEPLETVARFEFEEATVEVDHTAGPESPSVTTEQGTRLDLKQKEGATSFNQGVYLRWREFLAKLTESKNFESKRLTSLLTTELITDIYGECKEDRRL